MAKKIYNSLVFLFIAFMVLSMSSCFVRFFDSWAEYPDDGIAEEDRPEITLYFDLNGGYMSSGLVNGTLTGKYGGRIRLGTPTKEGYIFTGWVPSLPARFPAENTSYKATWNRTREYAINYQLSGGTNNYLNPSSYNIESSTITFQPATRQGYTFGGWYADSYFRNSITHIPSGTTGSITIYAKWIPGMSAYRIEHWLQNANDNNYTISPNDTETRTALSDSTTTASPRKYSGFVALNINQQKVAGDGSTVVKVYYNRNTVEFTFNLDGGTGTTVLRGKIGENVIAPSVPTKQGYAFVGWSPSLPSTFQTNMSFRAIWKVSADPTYRVEHWQQNPSGNNYTLYDTTTETKISSTGGNAGTVVKAYPGFTVQSIDQSKSDANGNAIVKIYYNRNIVRLTFDLDGGNGTKTIEGRYGANINSVSAPTKSGYTFVGWSPSLPSTFPTENATYRAMWSVAAVKYKVEHYQQNANDYNYTLVKNATETKSGTTGGITDASAKYFEGFTAQGFSQSAISADGSTVIKIYYDRNIVTLTFDLDGGAGMTNISGPYGSKITAISTPKRDGYNFTGWSPSLPSTFPSTNKTYRAQWTAIPVTTPTPTPDPTPEPTPTPTETTPTTPQVTTVKYKVEHWQQNPNDDGYTLVKNATETKSGTSGTETNAVAKNFPGFYSQWFTQTTIEADGSTVVQIYYDRVAADLNLDLDGGTGINLIKGRYGATVNPPPAPTKEGYTFAGWYPALPSTFPMASQVHKAIWTAN